MKDITATSLYLFKIVILACLITQGTAIKNSSCMDILKNYDIPLESEFYSLKFQEESKFLSQVISVSDLKMKLSVGPSEDNLSISHKKEYFVVEENGIKCLIKVSYRMHNLEKSSSSFNNFEDQDNSDKRNLQVSTLNCGPSSYFSVLFGMNLPTASSGTSNAFNKCNCLPGKINTNTKENNIFCGCDNNEFLKEDGVTCVSLLNCYNEGKTVIDNYCVSCAAGSTFNQTIKQCVCSTGSWRPNFCFSEPVTALTTGAKYDNTQLCAKNDMLTYVDVEPLQKVTLNVLLSPNFTLFIMSCTTNFTVNLRLNGVAVDFLTSFSQSVCSNAKKYLAFNAPSSNLYSLEIESTESTLAGKLIFLTELMKVNHFGLNAYLNLTNTNDATQNTRNFGILLDNDPSNDYFDQLFWNMYYGDVIVIGLLSGGSGSGNFRIRIGKHDGSINSLLGISLALSTSGSGSYYNYRIPQDGDYFIKFGCSLSTNCKGWLELLTIKTDNGFAKVYPLTLDEFTYSISNTETNNATKTQKTSVVVLLFSQIMITYFKI
jgi:hypothetical protein